MLEICQSLALLNLSRNRVDGYIPGKFFELSSLSILVDLSQNQLFGQLPEGRLIITLAGEIPSVMSIDGNNKLCRIFIYTC